MEGLLQSLKFEEIDTQQQVCKLVGIAAKRKGYGKDWWTEQTLYWDGQPIKRDSEEYQELLDEAFVALFTQNKTAREALLVTGNETLEHSIGKRSGTILTQQEFCSRLMYIRTQLQVRGLIEYEN